MGIEQNNTNPGTFDTKKLLDELLNDISREYGIDKLSAEKLIQSKSINNLHLLKEELNSINGENDNFDNSKLEKLFFTILGAKEVIEKASKNELNIIKQELEKIENFEEFNNALEDFLPANIISSAKNPKTLHENILGASLGASNTIIKTADILYQIGKGILKTPYDLYLIISGKGVYNGFKDI